MLDDTHTKAEVLVKSNAKGKIFVCDEGLSFWGGVDPATGFIIDIHHPNHGSLLSGQFVLMPTSRGSCSGSGVLLQLAQNGLAPSALIFYEPEEILTLGAIVADQLFGKKIAVLRVSKGVYSELSEAHQAEILENTLIFGSNAINLRELNIGTLDLSTNDRRVLNGEHGDAQKIAMETILSLIHISEPTRPY